MIRSELDKRIDGVAASKSSAAGIRQLLTDVLAAVVPEYSVISDTSKKWDGNMTALHQAQGFNSAIALIKANAEMLLGGETE